MADTLIDGLTAEQLKEEEQFYADSGAATTSIDEGGGKFSLLVSFADEPVEPAKTELPHGTDIEPPDLDGYVLVLQRLTTEQRGSLRRTVGVYQSFHDRRPVADVNGFCVERPGPGDNSQIGVANERRIAAGTYPLFTHAGDNGRYNTMHFRDPGGLSLRPWPCIGVENTDRRSGILIHCAAGFLMSIGCINLSRPLVNAQSNLDYDDSRARVIALITSIRNVLGDHFPGDNNLKIPTASLVVRDEPLANTSARDDIILQPHVRGEPSPGSPVAGLSDDWITTASDVTGHFENAGDPFAGVSGNFDGQGVSLGVLQWNIGQGSLPPLVKEGGEALVHSCMPNFGADFWKACNVSIPDGLTIVDSWQSSNRLPAEATTELRAYMGSPEMRAIQLKTIRATADRAHRMATTEWCTPRATGQPTLKEFCWFFDIVTQNGDLKGVRFSDVRTFTEGHPGGGAVEFICDWLKNVEAPPKIADDCAKNASAWPAILAAEDRDLFVLSHLRTLRSKEAFWGVVMNRKGTLTVGRGRVNQEDFDLRSIFNRPPSPSS